jgi:endoglucanase
MYACHFYAGSHGQWLRDKINYAMNKNLAIFVTEWGVTNYSGNGAIYLKEAKEWITFLKEKKISWANWSLSDHQESSAVLKPGANPQGNWTTSNLKESGMFLKSIME